MNDNSPTTLISFLGTNPSFKSDIPLSNIENNKLFIQDLSNNLDAVKSFKPLMDRNEEELQFISKNADYGERLENVINMISDEMGLTIDGVEHNLSIESRFENKMNKQNKSIPSPNNKFKPNF